MKRTIFCLLSVFLLVSCKTKREIIQLEPEIRTGYVERNKVSDDDFMLLAMLKQGFRNFSTSPMYSTDTWEGRLQSRLLELCNSQMFQSSQLGLVVYDITDGKYIFTINDNITYQTIKEDSLFLTLKTKANIIGVEIQKDVYDLAIESIELNNLS